MQIEKNGRRSGLCVTKTFIISSTEQISVILSSNLYVQHNPVTLILPLAQPWPRFPGLQIHSPVTWSQTWVSGSHPPQRPLHCGPNVPSGQGSEQVAPGEGKLHSWLADLTSKGLSYWSALSFFIFFYIFSHCLTMVGPRSLSSVSTGCVVPLSEDWAIFCHDG